MSTSRAQLRRIAYAGGMATKKRLASDPDYYKRIARLGGLAKAGTKRKPKPAPKGPDVAVAITPTVAAAIAQLDAG